jgi:aspartate aminotransferase
LQRLKRKEKIISLSLGEPDFNTQTLSKKQLKKSDRNYSTYSPVDGYAELKEAICRKFKRDNDLDYKPSQIVVSTGAKQSLYNIAQVMLNDGDEVILPAPWVSYFCKNYLAAYRLLPTSIENDFKTPTQLEAAITKLK